MADSEPAQQKDLVLAGIDRLRETAKWLIGAYAAVAAALVAGLQLGSLGKVEDDTRLWWAIAGAVVALACVVYAIWKVTNVLSPVQVTAADLGPDSKISKEAKDNPTLLKGRAASVPELRKKYEDAVADYQVKRQAALADPTKAADRDKAYATMMALFDPLEGIRKRVLFNKADARFRDTKRWLAGLSALVIAGAITYAWGANPSSESQQTAKVQESGPSLFAPSKVTVSVDPKRRSLKSLRARLGGRCDAAHVAALVVGGRPGSPDVVTLPEHGCNSVRFTAADDVGIAIPASTVQTVKVTP